MNTDSNTSINWEEVKAFYLTCRSYAATARHFGISPDSVRKRCTRNGWEQSNADKSGQDEDGKSTVCPQNGQVDANSTGQMRTEYGHETNKNRTNADKTIALCPESGQNESPHCTIHPPLPLYPVSTRFPKLPCIPNLSCREVDMLHPWLAPIAKRNSLPTKAAYREYIQNPETQDCLLSGVVGEVAGLRVSRENPPARLLAVVADYDLELSCDKREKMLAKLLVRPNFISRSYSGGTHAVWFLEKPLPLPSDQDALDRLLATIRKELKLTNAFGPLDVNAFNKLSQVYHAGWDWRMVHDDPIPEERSLLWLMDALNKPRRSSNDIPLSIIAEEVQRRFPGRWQGEFTIGARGVRFWDAQADNPTAAIVTAQGMVCFTGPFSWRSWEDIFGKDFLSQYRADTLGKVLAHCYFVNNTFYVRSEFRGTPSWQTFNRQNMESLLTSLYGLRSRAAKDEDQSEVKAAISSILHLNSLPAARPFIYNPATIVLHDGSPVLNTSLLRVHKPEPNLGKSWGDGFPWTAAFLESLFPDIVQRDRFMCEWAYAYRHAYAGQPRNGRVIFIAGDVGVGKNFLTECLIGPSLGGYTDPSSYLLGHTRFNDSFFDVGAWVCNDTVARGDERERHIFTASLKRMAANVRHVWEGKYKGSSSISWSGRVYVTLNTDPVSLQILPDIDQSNRDKISLYRVSGQPLKDTLAALKAKEELGALCAYLLHMEFPEHCCDTPRWGVRNYLHPDLLAEAVNSGSTASFGEILTLFCRDMFAADTSLERLEGPATWFLQKMLEQSSLKEMLRGCETPKSFGRRMSVLSNTGSFPVSYYRSTNERRWCVERAAFEKFARCGNQEGEVDEQFPF